MVDQKTEASYRAIKLDSSSSIKDFSLDRKKYYRKYILEENVGEKYNQAIFMGQIVETLLLEPDLFDSKFYMSACVSPPTNLMLAFVEALYEEAVKATDEDGKVTASFDYMSKEAYERSGFKTKYETVIKKFGETDAVVYFEEICNVRSKNLTVVETKDVTNAERIVEELQNNPITKDLVSLRPGKHITMFDQLQVEGYEVFGHKFKSMMDRVIVNHEQKTIQVMDLKCTWSVEGFFTEYYLYRRSYIQAYLYKKACEHLKAITPEYADYEVLNPIFLVCDSINYFSPLVFTLSDEDLELAENGFYFKNKYYPGVEEIVENLKWALENDIWNISKDAHEKGGILNITHGFEQFITPA